MSTGWFEAWLEASGFLDRYPQYAGVLSRLEPVATGGVPVMAVALGRLGEASGPLRLLVNLDHFRAHPEHWSGVLLHEIHHVLFGHLTDESLHAVAFPAAMEVAMEVAANEPIDEPLPGGGIRLEEFERFGLRPGQSTLHRYHLLEEAERRGDIHFEPYCVTRLIDTHSGTMGLRSAIARHTDRPSEGRWNRARGRAGMGAPAGEEELAELRRQIRDHLGGERGGDAAESLDPGRERRSRQLQRLAFAPTDGGGVDWARALALAFPRRREVQASYLRPNRRFPDRIGEIPGRLRRPPERRLLVGVDTSASMTIEALGRVARELRRLQRHARLTVAESDAAIQRLTRGPHPGVFVGGGDTDFGPVLAHGALAGDPHEGVVYFTDGKGEVPPTPPGLAVLWVLTGDEPFDGRLQVRLPAA